MRVIHCESKSEISKKDTKILPSCMKVIGYESKSKVIKASKL